MPKPILSVNNLTKAFRSGGRTLTVVRGVSFSLAEGASCAVVGPSGSGKTTLIALCAGLERPSAGSVFFDGVELSRASEEELARIRRERIGFIFQTFQLIPSLTALENVMVPAEIRGDKQARSRAAELLERVGLEERLRHYPAQLSGGEQQRVAIARAFVNRPRLLLADEPTGNLDAETSRSVIELLFELNRSAGATLLLVTHDGELTRQAGRVIELRAGAIASDSAANGAGAD